MGAVDVIDDQLPAVVFFRCAEKKRGGDVGTDPVRCPWYLPDRVVQMRTEGFPSFITVEERWKDPERQRRCDKKRVALQGCNDHIAQFPCLGAVLLKLAIVLNHAGLVTGGDAPVYPRRPIHYLPAMGDLFLAKNIGNMDNHQASVPLKSKERARDKSSRRAGHDVGRMHAFNKSGVGKILGVQTALNLLGDVVSYRRIPANITGDLIGI